MHSRITLIAVLVLSVSFFCHSQTTATCDHWKFFKSFSASGINRWNTVVGTGTLNGSTVGFVRYSNGGVTTYKFPNASQTHFSKRNASGVSVGDVDFNHGLIVTGSSATQSRELTNTMTRPISVQSGRDSKCGRTAVSPPSMPPGRLTQIRRASATQGSL